MTSTAKHNVSYYFWLSILLIGAIIILYAGVYGGFTTFSTFANESLKMLQTGNTWGFIGHVAISVVVGIGLTALGYLLVK